MLALQYPGTTPDYWRAASLEDIVTALDVLDESRPEENGN